MNMLIKRGPEGLAVLALLGMGLYGAGLVLWPNLGELPLILVLGVSALPLSLQAFQKVLKKDISTDVLAVTALWTSGVLGEYLAGCLIVLMLAGGQTLERYATRKASSVLEALAKRMPSTAHRQCGDTLEDVPLSEICVGDFVVIFPHETAPVDGIVRRGQGTMDESYLTGEPYRVDKAPGAMVLSGAINGDAALVVEALKPASDSRYASIMTVMRQAQERRPALRRLGDQIGALFAPIAFILAIAAWILTGDSVRFLAVLVVATPCPLLIAIPVTIMSAISLAAKRGVIIRDPIVLERLPTCRTAIFDKTGTLTYGRPQVSEVVCGQGFQTQTLLQAAASLERYSKHPLAQALLEAASKEGMPLLQASHVSEKPGQGLFGIIDGVGWHLTSREQVRQKWPELLDALPPMGPGLECLLLCQNQFAGLFRLRDAVRAEGKSFIGHLRPFHQIRKIILLSGDRASEVSYLAEILGIKETFASQSPEQKVEIVRAHTLLAPTLYMGDGINDAPALATATVGLAFGQHSSSVTSQAAGAVILDSTLEKVDELLHISLSLRRIALQSAVGGTALSLIGMGLAATGHLSPVQGALTQEVIDALAIMNALRLAFRPHVVTDMT